MKKDKESFGQPFPEGGYQNLHLPKHPDQEPYEAVTKASDQVSQDAMQAIDPAGYWIPMRTAEDRKMLDEAYEKGVSFVDIQNNRTYNTPIPPAYLDVPKPGEVRHVSEGADD